MKPQLILASASPRRAALLKQLGLEFRVISSHLPETVAKQNPDPARLAETLALAKARQVEPLVTGGIIIGADTIVVLGDRILTKPVGPEAARQMLSQLSGREHTVLTGLAVLEVPGGRSRVTSVATRVRFRSLSPELIAAYVATGEPLDKAGAYGIQGKGAVLVETISGCYFNVVGLPLNCLTDLLAEFGVEIF